jgi:hypothetical protein
MSELCVVMLCNKSYFNKFLNTCQQLITNGKYKGDICLIIGNDLKDNYLLRHNLILNNNIYIKHFPDLNFPEEVLKVFYDMERPAHWVLKLFQYHKLYLFDIFFKKWKYILYIDCAIKVFSDILPIINTKKENTLLAHSDAYPTYVWKLKDQFNKKLKTINNKYLDELEKMYDLDIDYFQTCVMLYDTNIIHKDTFKNLYELIIKYPISGTNDQGIIALYFTNIEKKYEQIPIKDDNIYFYDYLPRNQNNKYIMLKS